MEKLSSNSRVNYENQVLAAEARIQPFALAGVNFLVAESGDQRCIAYLQCTSWLDPPVETGLLHIRYQVDSRQIPWFRQRRFVIRLIMAAIASDGRARRRTAAIIEVAAIDGIQRVHLERMSVTR